jgi:hypothetical protein
MVCCTLPAHTRIGSILDFQWSGVKLPIWLSALLSIIICATDVQMAHARPFWTSTLQNLFNDIKNASMQGVLTPTIALWIFGNPGGLPSPIFGSVSGDFTTPSKWGCDMQHCFNSTFATSSSITTLQHRFYNIVFCSITSTLPLQHYLLQHRFYSWVVARFRVFGGAEVGSWGLKCLGSWIDFFNG